MSFGYYLSPSGIIRAGTTTFFYGKLVIWTSLAPLTLSNSLIGVCTHPKPLIAFSVGT